MNTMNILRYTDNDKRRIKERISKYSFKNEECLIWKNRNLIIKIKFEDGISRNISPSKFVLGRKTNTIDISCKKIRRKCGNKFCIEEEHLTFDQVCPIQRILSYTTTNENGCFIHKNGEYSRTTVESKKMSTHRAMFMLVKNNGAPIPKYDKSGEELVIRHMCNDGRCVNPDHLEIGTNSENNYEDKKKYDTLGYGEKNPMAVISEKLATKIKHSIRSPQDPEYMSKSERANKFNVSLAIVKNIDSNLSWSHIPDINGIIFDNSEKRKKRKIYRQNKKQEEWNDQKFENALKKIKTHIVESDDFKHGYLPNGKCWIWKLGKDSNGYGKVSYEGHETHSHILSCEIKYKRKRIKGEIVRHLCDNRICCNPEHLEFGTFQENSIDYLENEKNKTSKLRKDEVIEIYNSSETQKDLAIRYGVTISTINLILNGKTWSHLTKHVDN